MPNPSEGISVARMEKNDNLAFDASQDQSRKIIENYAV
jgi:hypothetical protein